VSLQTPEKIQTLQRGLYAKAKQEPAFRFYTLYDKLYRPDILEHAWRLTRAKGGAAGVDGVTFEKIEEYGVEKWLAELGKELQERTYQPQAVRRVMIPKPGGGERPLGIPTIKDRVAQRAALIVLEPIFEADMEASAFGYRPKRSAHDAIEEVQQGLVQGYREVVDADLSSYFDTIPHQELMKLLIRRISDSAMLHLLKLWLKVPVEEKDPRGKWRRTIGRGKRSHGVPQGGVISPLLANIYINRFLASWRIEGKLKEFGARIINYADDFVVLSKRRALDALKWTRQKLDDLGLKLNEAKTRVVQVPETSFDFLGYTFGQLTFPKTGTRYIGATPSRKSVDRIKDKVVKLLHPGQVDELQQVVARLNRKLIGWENYFSVGTKWRAYNVVNEFVRTRFLSFLCRRHKVSSRGTGRFSIQAIYGKEIGLYHIGTRRKWRASVCALA
jgi:RNA-directed DNA polymerase